MVKKLKTLLCKKRIIFSLILLIGTALFFFFTLTTIQKKQDGFVQNYIQNGGMESYYNFFNKKVIPIKLLSKKNTLFILNNILKDTYSNIPHKISNNYNSIFWEIINKSEDDIKKTTAKTTLINVFDKKICLLNISSNIKNNDIKRLVIAHEMGHCQIFGFDGIKNNNFTKSHFFLGNSNKHIRDEWSLNQENDIYKLQIEIYSDLFSCIYLSQNIKVANSFDILANYRKINEKWYNNKSYNTSYFIADFAKRFKPNKRLNSEEIKNIILEYLKTKKISDKIINTIISSEKTDD